jgi:hypothetical protein
MVFAGLVETNGHGHICEMLSLNAGERDEEEEEGVTHSQMIY